jgi:hypothetical protein
VDDILALFNDQQKILFTLLQFYFLIKKGYDKPNFYLGTQLKEWCFPDGATNPKWVQSLEKYVKEAIKNVEHSLNKIEI